MFKLNSNIKFNIIEKIFSSDRKIQKIDAKVIGYSFEIYKRGNGGGYDYSYLYGFEYQINNRKFFGRTIIAENENKGYNKYLPLPKTIPIIVNTNEPGQFIFLYKYTNDGIFWWFLDVFYILISIVLLYNQRNFVLSDFLPKINKNNKIGDSVQYFFLFIVAIIPFSMSVTFFLSSKRGNVSDNVTDIQYY